MAESPLDLHPIDDGTPSPFAQPGPMASAGVTARGSSFVDAGLHPPTATAGAVTAWRCPACGHDQVGVFEQGCPGCGAGKPGFRVGAAPPRRQQEVDRERRQQPPVATPVTQPAAAVQPAAAAPLGPSPSRLAFEQWIAARPEWRANDEVFWQVWDAAWQAATTIPVTGAQAMHLPLPDPLREALDGRDAEIIARTIAAALDHFLDTVLAHATPEEIAIDGWLSVEDTRALAEQIRPH